MPREEEKVQELAEDFHTKVIGTLSRSDLVPEAEVLGKTLLECYPDSEMAGEYRILAEEILAACRRRVHVKKSWKQGDSGENRGNDREGFFSGTFSGGIGI